MALPHLRVSDEHIKIVSISSDTFSDYWKILGSTQFAALDNNGENAIYSVLNGIGIKFGKEDWETFSINKPGVEAKTYVVFSDLVQEELLYFIVNQTLWCYNTRTNAYQTIIHFKDGLRDSKGVRYDIMDGTFNQSPAIVYSSVLNTLYFPVWTSHKGCNKFLGTLDLGTMKTGVLDYERPDVDVPIQRGMQDNTMYVIDSLDLYVAFAYNKMGIKLNLKSLSCDTLNILSRYDTLPQMAYTREETGIKDFGERFMKTKIYSAYYGFLIFNPFKQHYYKIFYKPLAEDNPKTGLKNTLAEKRLVLMIYDRKMQLMEELELSGNYNWINSVLPSRNGVILLNASNSGDYNLPGKTQILRIDYE